MCYSLCSLPSLETCLLPPAPPCPIMAFHFKSVKLNLIIWCTLSMFPFVKADRDLRMNTWNKNMGFPVKSRISRHTFRVFLFGSGRIRIRRFRACNLCFRSGISTKEKQQQDSGFWHGSDWKQNCVSKSQAESRDKAITDGSVFHL